MDISSRARSLRVLTGSRSAPEGRESEEADVPRAEQTLTINRPVGEVFDFIADGENNAKWRSGVLLARQTTPGPVGPGTVVKQEHKGPFGRRIAADYEITEYERGARLAFRVIAGPARPEGRYSFDEVEGATRVRFELRWEPKGWARHPLVHGRAPDEGRSWAPERPQGPPRVARLI